MHFTVVLNRDGGTLKTMDVERFATSVRERLGAAGHTVDMRIVEGAQIIEELGRAARGRKSDIVMAGGGDGTISAAAAALAGNRKALAILPAGTMNLFARSLGIPLALDEAVAAFATGKVIAVDVASANGRVFVHQFSVGLHAKMVHLREKMNFRSRLGKIRASARAAASAILNPPILNVTLKIGEAEIEARTTGIGFTNNLFGEGHLPYADSPAGGALGIYVTIAQRPGEVLRFAANLARGRWTRNDQVEIHEARNATLTIRSSRGKWRAVIDGELEKLGRETTFEIHPAKLKVLVPA
ncbi:MAG: diacylglycerol kinase family protein [Rhizobiaceae bacterium]